MASNPCELGQLPMLPNGWNIDQPSPPPGIQLSSVVIHQIMLNVMQHPYVIGALDTITTRLLSGGLLFYHRNRRMRQAYRRLLTPKFKVLVRQLVHDWFAVGLAFVCIHPDDQFIMLPRILPLRECNISFVDDGFRRSYNIAHASLPKRHHIVHVLERFPPLNDGTLQSPAASLLFHLSLNRSLWQFHMQTTNARSRMMLGFAPAPQRETQKAQTDEPFFLTNTMCQLNQARYNMDINAVRGHHQQVVDVLQRTHETRREKNDPFLSINATNRHHIQLLQVPQPVQQIERSGEDIVNMISLATGVPAFYFDYSRTHRNASENELHEKRLESALDEWSSHIEAVLSDLLHDMYAHLDRYEEFKAHWLRLEHLPQTGLQPIQGRMAPSSKRRQLLRAAKQSEAKLQLVEVPDNSSVHLNRAHAPSAPTAPTAPPLVAKLSTTLELQTTPTTKVNTDDWGDMSESDDSEDDHVLARQGSKSNSRVLFNRTYEMYQRQQEEDLHPDDRLVNQVLELLQNHARDHGSIGSQLDALLLHRQEQLRQSTRTHIRNTDSEYRRRKRVNQHDKEQTQQTRRRIVERFHGRLRGIDKLRHRIVQFIQDSALDSQPSSSPSAPRIPCSPPGSDTDDSACETRRKRRRK